MDETPNKNEYEKEPELILSKPEAFMLSIVIIPIFIICVIGCILFRILLYTYRMLCNLFQMTFGTILTIQGILSLCIYKELSCIKIIFGKRGE